MARARARNAAWEIRRARNQALAGAGPNFFSRFERQGDTANQKNSAERFQFRALLEWTNELFDRRRFLRSCVVHFTPATDIPWRARTNPSSPKWKSQCRQLHGHSLGDFGNLKPRITSLTDTIPDSRQERVHRWQKHRNGNDSGVSSRAHVVPAGGKR